ncbi:zinc finger protein 77-like isoform X17 [Spodoptera litura]|uniref:Zinc finger protein 77-like isoform X17 n=1 Tax=Spodoptera litura TaxID=69820 RepID=A0A9J7DUY0_SPOLT|nr:zinc finger protein 77-like isoform X17 [Spodoptera litura]
MDPKTTDWRAGPNVCRCCLAEGCYKDISTEYFWMGKREVYAEMLSETLNLSIAYSNSGGPNSNSRLICELCISRLRDASDFKRQVQECERTFLRHLDPGSSSMVGEVEVTVEPTEIDPDVKLEHVKQEKAVSDDDDDFDERCGFDEDDDDDLDDQPLTRLASRIPKKESVDLLDLLDNTKATEKRKSSSKTKTVPAKKAKTIKKDVKATSSKAPVKTEKKKKAESYDATRSNAETIISSTTAYPFRVNDKSILCVYCQELFEDPEVFRNHMDAEHDYFSIKVAFHHLPKNEFIKVDLTNLRCRICKNSFPNLEDIMTHVESEHGKKVDKAGKFGVMPYFLQKDVYNCAVCDKNFPSLFHLNRHTITHFLSYVCHVCGSSYVATTGLLRHVRSKHQNYEVSCKKCKKVFPTMEAKEKHRRTQKSCMPYCCSKCQERFLDYKTRKKHMEVAHGQSKRTYRCADCNIDFVTENSYYEHFKLHHSEDCAVCKHCGMKFLSLYRLKRHISKHNV